MADATLQQDWPDRRVEILAVTGVLCILSTVFLLWRMIHGIKTDRKFLVCDYLLMIAGILNIVTTAIRFKTTYHGQGRHIRDPSIRKPYDLLQYSYYLWIGQILNLLAVAILKYSICAYLLALRFSKIYLAIVWASILMVTSFNVLYPMISLFTCKPFEANWNKAIKGDCFVKPSVVMTYFNGVTNIVTDLVYVVAPIIYLSTIQLPRRTQWGLRAVFILSLVPTLCSIMKTTHFNALRKTKDPTWDAVDLSIWSATELSVGILAAALPPLRKQFDKFFRAILPTTLRGTRSKPPSGIPMYDLSKPATVGSKPRKRTGVTQDDDSERSILPNAEGAITKTVVHEVTTEKRSDDIKLPSNTFDTNMKV